MTNADRILAILTYAHGPLCDDCLAVRADVCSRQTVCQVCADLAASGAIYRAKSACADCRKVRKSSAIRPWPEFDA